MQARASEDPIAAGHHRRVAQQRPHVDCTPVAVLRDDQLVELPDAADRLRFLCRWPPGSVCTWDGDM
jgi:hypothetical protein